MASRHPKSRQNESRLHPLRFEPLEVRRVLTAWHNAALAADVDGSGVVAPLDALLVINEVGDRVFSSPVDGKLPVNRPNNAPFLDVTDNLVVAPLDALLVINELDAEPNVFTINENATDGAFVGRIQPTGGVTPDTIFELAKNEALPVSIVDILELKPDDHYKGAANAPVIVIEYLDFACPICGLYHPLVQQALEDFDGEVAVVSRHLPLTSIHPNAQQAAIAAEAAGRQGMFDEMADLLFTRRISSGWDSASNPTSTFRDFAQELGLDLAQFDSDVDDPALEARVMRDSNEAVTGLGFTGTPSFAVNDQAEAPPGVSQAAVNQMVQNALDAVELPFNIDRFTGEITVRDGTTLDFETTPMYEFDVIVNGAMQTVTIDVGDVAEA